LYFACVLAPIASGDHARDGKRIYGRDLELCRCERPTWKQLQHPSRWAPRVARREEEEEIGDAIASKNRNVLAPFCLP
jgi:hypothetical protein